MLVARSRMQTEDNELTERAHEWIDGVHAQFAGSAVPAAGAGAVRRDGLQDSVTVREPGSKRSNDCSQMRSGQR